MRYTSLLGINFLSLPSNFSMTFNQNHFDVTDGTSGTVRNYKVPDLRHSTKFDPATLYAGELTTVATMATGTGNDSNALRTAITNALSSTEYLAGETVCVAIPAGTFTFASEVLVDSDRIHICGAGQGVTIIDIGSNDLGSISGAIKFESPSFGIH